jgi:hypothetical protein
VDEVDHEDGESRQKSVMEANMGAKLRRDVHTPGGRYQVEDEAHRQCHRCGHKDHGLTIEEVRLLQHPFHQAPCSDGEGGTKVAC